MGFLARTPIAAIAFFTAAVSTLPAAASGVSVAVGQSGASVSLGNAFVVPSVLGLVGSAPGSGTAPRLSMNAMSATTDSPNATTNGPDQKWGDPLSADLFDASNAKVRLRYYSDVAGTGDQQGVGLNLSLPTN